VGSLATCSAYGDAEGRAGGTSTCGCGGSTTVSLVAKGQYSTGTSLVMFSGFKLLMSHL